jgi:hypothetical protein
MGEACSPIPRTVASDGLAPAGASPCTRSGSATSAHRGQAQPGRQRPRRPSSPVAARRARREPQRRHDHHHRTRRLPAPGRHRSHPRSPTRTLTQTRRFQLHLEGIQGAGPSQKDRKFWRSRANPQRVSGLSQAGHSNRPAARSASTTTGSTITANTLTPAFHVHAHEARSTARWRPGATRVERTTRRRTGQTPHRPARTTPRW